MATKTLNIRVQSKYDVLANWNANNPVLLKGEVAYVIIPSESGAMATEPVVLTKVGDGTSNFQSLSYVGALAADVYSWRKQIQNLSTQQMKLTVWMRILCFTKW